MDALPSLLALSPELVPVALAGILIIELYKLIRDGDDDEPESRTEEILEPKG